MKKEEEKYPIRTTSTFVEFKYDKGAWEVILTINMTRISIEGEKEEFGYKVKAYDKEIPRALVTVQASASAYLNTHSEEELYGPAKDQVTGIKNSKT